MKKKSFCKKRALFSHIKQSFDTIDLPSDGVSDSVCGSRESLYRLLWELQLALGRD